MAQPARERRFPLVPGTKQPAVAWKTFNGEVASEPYGLPCGPENGFWVLDLDQKPGVNGAASLLEFMNGRHLPTTRIVKTPSGGMHWYFAWAQGVRNRQAILPGVDVRGDGGYVCAGAPYTVADSAAIAEAPEWLLELVRHKEEPPPAEPVDAIREGDPRHPDRVRQAIAYLVMAPPCISGKGGQAKLWEIALRLTRTYELAPEFLVDFAPMKDYNARCEPPWETADLLRTLRRAATQGYGPTGTFSLTNPLLSTPAKQSATAAVGYSFDIATEIHGGDVNKAFPYKQRQVTMIMCGKSAAPAWQGVWRYDEFRHQLRAFKPPMPLDAETQGLSSSDIEAVRMWYACTGATVTSDQVRAAIEVSAKAAKFHPVRDYLAELPETSRENANRYFIDAATRLWGGTDAESAMLRRLAIGAVRRVRVPGTKLDTMLVLAGPQGWNKSRFCAKLFTPFFREQMPDLSNDREASAALEGAWGVELAELASFTRASEQTKKNFLSRLEDQYRPVWERHVMVFPRQCVFIGTTNEDDFLGDPTGARRYDVCDIKRPLAVDDLDRDEFWSSAKALESSGEIHWCDDSVENSDQMLEKYGSDDPWTEVILKACKKRGSITASEALSFGPAISMEKQDQFSLLRAKRILRKHCGPAKMQRTEIGAARHYHWPGSTT